MMNINKFDFSPESSFIIDLREKMYNDLIKDLKDINIIKPKDDDIFFLNNIISDYKSKNIENGNDLNDETILLEYKIARMNFILGIKKLNERMKTIINIFSGFKMRENISLKKIEINIIKLLEII